MKRTIWKVIVRRLICFALALLLTGSVPVDPVIAVEQQSTLPILLASSRLENVPEGNWVYFGTASASLEESEKEYTVPVFRAGDLRAEAQVEIRSFDMTALYGRDYELIMSNAEKSGSDATILESYMTAALNAQDDLLEDDASSTAVETVCQDVPEENDADTQTNMPISALAQMKEEATGQPTRETYKTEVGADVESFLSSFAQSMIPSAMDDVEYSASVVLAFAPGENVQWVTFRLLEDTESEGVENFSLSLINGENVEPYSVTNLAVSISDNEPQEHSVVTFTAPRYDSENGIATVVVRRTGAEYSLVDMRIFTSESTAKAHENYEPISETLTFLPYETEKKYEIPVGGTGDFTLLLDSLAGCKPGQYVKTKVHITSEGKSLMAKKSGASSFTISIGGENYTVEYNSGEPTGRILTDATPPVEVGTYYFALPDSNGGMFQYDTNQSDGDKPLKIGTLSCAYVEGDAQHNAYGDIAYYHTYTARKGSVWAQSTKDIPGIYYQYITPEWTSTKDTYGGQTFRIRTEKLDLEAYAYGKFDRTAGNAVIRLENKESNDTNRNLDLKISAVDDSARTPKSYLRFYGVAAMYKRYEVAVDTPRKLRFLTGTGASIEADPIQLYIRCGHQSASLVTTDLKRDVYANSEEADANVVFSLDNSKVNEMLGKFATIKGYTITIKPDNDQDENGNTIDNSVTLNYPEDFIAFLQERSRPANIPDYGSESVNREIQKINANLNTIPFDMYFIDWIDAHQKAVVNSDKGYFQRLIFEPKYAYIDVPVTTFAPVNGKNAGFADEQLGNLGSYTYHAGDVLDLHTWCKDAGYEVTGYEVSYDKGVKWNIIRNTDKLELKPGDVDGVYIRPLVEEIKNYIEIRFADEEAKLMEVLGANYGGFVSDELLEDGLKGKHILRINDGITADEQMCPRAGEIYPISFSTYTDEFEGIEFIYYPVITDSFGNSYAGTTFYYVARSDARDNVLTLGYHIVLKEHGSTSFTFNGRLVSNYPPIRSTGTDTEHFGVEGYTITAPGAETKVGEDTLIESVMTQTDKDGYFTLENVSGVSVKPMTLLVSNGSDSQVITITPNSGDIGNIQLDYPATAPEVIDINYSYEKIVNNMEADNTQNSVRIYDDTLLITATVDAKGHKVVGAEFTVYTTTGEVSSFEASYNSDSPGLFTCTIPQMAELLHNGDRVRVRLLTEEIIANDTLRHTFPSVDTGLVFYVENDTVIPKVIQTPETPTMNIPNFGNLNGSASSELLSFQKYYWDEQRTNYSLVVNLGAVLATRNNGTMDNVNEVNQITNSMKKMEEDIGNIMFRNENSLGTGYLDEIQYDLNRMRGDNYDFDWHPKHKEYTEMQDWLDTSERVINNNGKVTNGLAKKYSPSYSGFNSANQLQAQAATTLAFNFTFDPTQNAYVFTTGSVCVGCLVKYDKSWYTTFYGIPIYLNLSGHVATDLTLMYRTKNLESAMPAATFDRLSGNLIGQLSSDQTAELNMHMDVKIKASAGVGICGVLGAKGSLALEMMFLIPMSKDISEEYGVLVMGTGSIGIDLVLTSMDLELAKAAYGAGVYANRTEISFFEGTLKSDLTGSGNRRSANPGSLQFVSNEYASGTSNMSSFGKAPAIRATLQETLRTVLLNDAAERTAPQIIQMDDGRRMIFFIGHRGGDNRLNSRALFWSVCENGQWSEPQIVSNDGTTDASPVALQKNGKVVLAWVDADRAYTETDSLKDKLNALGISMAIYENGKMSQELPLVEDAFFNFAPQLNLVGDTLYCSYMKRDISSVTKDEDLLDFTGLYSTMAYVELDVPSRTVVDEGFTVVEHPVLTDPLVMDYHSATVTLNGQDYMVATYTVDEDENLNTQADRELFLSITNLTLDRTYYPIALTSDQHDQANPRLTEFDGTLYLTWMEHGYLFNMMDVTEILEAFFATEAVGDIYINAVGQDWYRKSDDQLPDLGSGENTFYDLANQGIFPYEQTNFHANENRTTGISDYVLTTDGDDIYIFYTDFGSDEMIDFSKELYGVRYKRDMVEDDVAEEWGFGKSVKITDYGKVIDEFDLYMTPDHKVSLVSNHYEQGIDSEGVAYESSNQLVEIEFSPASSLAVVDDRIALPEAFVAGNTESIHVDVVNNGLLTATGFQVSLTEVTDGKETVVYTESYNTPMDSGEIREIVLPWTVPENTSDMQLKVTVTEQDVEVSKSAEVVTDLPYEAMVLTTDASLDWEGDEAVYTATLTNTGNKPAEATKIGLALSNENEEEDVLLDEMTLPALNSGESAKVTFAYRPKVEDFTDLGAVYLNLKEQTEDGYKKLDGRSLYAHEPMVAEIDGGAETLTLSTDTTRQLTAKIAPWSSIGGKMRWSSSDPTVATVDQNGILTAVAKGSATITVYYDCGITDTITVTVDEHDGTEIPPSHNFTDVPTDAYYADAVTWAVEEGITLGTTATTFSPDAPCTRAQALTFLWRCAGSPEPRITEAPFADVSEGAYYYDAVLWAVEEGIALGTSATTFSPDALCTRAQALTFLWRWRNAPTSEADLPFADVDPNAYYAQAVKWAVEQGITTGTTATTFSPDALCARVQCVTFLWRLCEK